MLQKGHRHQPRKLLYLMSTADVMTGQRSFPVLCGSAGNSGAGLAHRTHLPACVGARGISPFYAMRLMVVSSLACQHVHLQF